MQRLLKTQHHYVVTVVTVTLIIFILHYLWKEQILPINHLFFYKSNSFSRKRSIIQHVCLLGFNLK